MHASSEKNSRVKQLEKEIEYLRKTITKLEHNVETLTQALLHATKKRFGASSEKTKPAMGQYTIWGEEIENDITGEDNSFIRIKEHKRPVRKKR